MYSNPSTLTNIVVTCLAEVNYYEEIIHHIHMLHPHYLSHQAHMQTHALFMHLQIQMQINMQPFMEAILSSSDFTPQCLQLIQALGMQSFNHRGCSNIKYEFSIVQLRIYSRCLLDIPKSALVGTELTM